MLEYLYKAVIPLGTVYSLAWSGANLIAVSVSVKIQSFTTESYGCAKVHQLLVFDPDRPWDFHPVVPDSKSIVIQLEWSLDGRRLLALDEGGVIHIWRMKTQCMNEWVCAHKQGPPPSPAPRLVHAAWLEYRPMVTVNHTKEDWSEAMEFQPFCPQIGMLLGNAFISVYDNGNVCVTSASIGRSHDVTAETKLEGEGAIVTAKTLVTPAGSVLAAVGYEDGHVKVFSLSLALCQAGGFTVSSTLATEVRPTGTPAGADNITALLMLPHIDGCVLHVCYNESHLYQWSVKDITHSGSYQAKREHTFSSPEPVKGLAASSICLGSCDSSPENDIIMLDAESDVHNEGRWPVEVVVVVGERGRTTVINRDSYKVLHTCQPCDTPEDETGYPAAKRSRIAASERAPCIAHLSPNSCCFAIGNRENIQVFQMGEIILGLKDSTTPEVPRCSRLLSLSMVTYQLPWDLTVVCSRMETKRGPGFVKQVMEHFTREFSVNAASLRNHTLAQYFSTCAMLHSCHADGLQAALSYRNMARLQGTAALLGLSLPSSSSSSPSSSSSSSPSNKEDMWLMDALQDVCSSKSGEESLESIAKELQVKDFVILSDTASQLQGHANWIIEFAIRVVSAAAAGRTANVPEAIALGLLRQSLLLVYLWNKAFQPQAIVPVTDGALSLLFKALTKYIRSPSTPLPDDIQSEISSNIPSEKHPNLLTLTKAAHLQGFINGLSAASLLPESYQRGMFPRIRPHVQRNCSSKDPFSPLSLVVPKGLSPPWQDCFVESQKDVLHGGAIMKNVVQNARLKQCSRVSAFPSNGEETKYERKVVQMLDSSIGELTARRGRRGYLPPGQLLQSRPPMEEHLVI